MRHLEALALEGAHQGHRDPGVVLDQEKALHASIVGCLLG
jgi:hypothetical protein